MYSPILLFPHYMWCVLIILSIIWDSYGFIRQTRPFEWHMDGLLINEPRSTDASDCVPLIHALCLKRILIRYKRDWELGRVIGHMFDYVVQRGETGTESVTRPYFRRCWSRACEIITASVEEAAAVAHSRINWKRKPLTSQNETTQISKSKSRRRWWCWWREIAVVQFMGRDTSYFEIK